MLVKVEGLYIPADFIILDTRKEEDDCIILGRPFLATAKAMIDVDRGELVLQLNEDYLLFKTQGSSSVNMEKKHEKLLSVQSQKEPHNQTLSLVLGGHNQTLSLVLRPHIQTLSLVLGLYNIDMITCVAP